MAHITTQTRIHEEPVYYDETQPLTQSMWRPTHIPDKVYAESVVSGLEHAFASKNDGVLRDETVLRRVQVIKAQANKFYKWRDLARLIRSSDVISIDENGRNEQDGKRLTVQPVIIRMKTAAVLTPVDAVAKKIDEVVSSVMTVRVSTNALAAIDRLVVKHNPASHWCDRYCTLV